VCTCFECVASRRNYQRPAACVPAVPRAEIKVSVSCLRRMEDASLAPRTPAVAVVWKFCGLDRERENEENRRENLVVRWAEELSGPTGKFVTYNACCKEFLSAGFHVLCYCKSRWEDNGCLSPH
jgi:hypothetical protein